MLKIYNSMSRCLEDFVPRNKNNVKIFTCGPSIYQKAHIGNYRTFLYEDLLIRYLQYSGFKVERAMNLTDIEDKAINEAKKKNTDVKSLTDDVLAIFREGIDGFGFIMPDHLIPATDSIQQSVKIIKNLVKKGIAYEHRGDFFFDPMKVENFGKLFRLDLSRWPAGRRRFRKDTYNGNRWNLGDFILWHNHKNDPDHPFWKTELGKGRPSWNIQDPSVVTMSLGEQVDINCGGIDNIYRHHDYNIAVMEAYTGKEYSRYYMHGEHLIVNGRTMSKTRGNIIYPEQLIAEGYSWKEIRFFLTYTHYRKKLNFTEKAMTKTARLLRDFKSELRTVESSSSKTAAENTALSELIESIPVLFNIKLDSDLALGAGFDAVHGIIKRISAESRKTPLTPDQNKKLINNLEKIDNVLNVIYP